MKKRSVREERKFFLNKNKKETRRSSTPGEAKIRARQIVRSSSPLTPLSLTPSLSLFADDNL